MTRSLAPLLFSILVAVAAARNATAQANLLAYDSLDYTGALDGVDGGAGFTGPWVGVPAQAPGLFAYWALENNVNDSGIAGAHGVMIGGSFSTDTPAALAHSTASLSLGSANNEWVDLAAHVGSFRDFRVGGFSCWVKQSMGQGGTNAILSASNSFEPSKEVRLFIENSVAEYDVRGEVNSWGRATGSGGLASGTPINDGMWHHIAVSIAPNDVAKIWIGGALENEDREGLFRHFLSLDSMAIGRNVDSSNPGGQWYYSGLIDDLAFFTGELSQADVTALASGASPTTILGTPPLPGPFLRGATLDSPAYRSRDFVPDGDAVGDLFGGRAHRFLDDIIDLRVNATYYISALVRREDQPGVPTTGGLIELSDGNATRGWFGWDASGAFVVGLNADSISPVQMLDATTYFCVMRIDAVSSGDDVAYLKVYAPNDVIDATDANFVGVGTGPTEWAATEPGPSGARNTHILITQLQIGSLISVDEVRVGSTWESVTSLGYGQGCLGGKIGQTGRPVIGSTSYRVTLSGVRANQAAAFVLGFDRENWGALALPFDLTFAGATNCFFLCAQDVAIGTTTDGAGNASLPIFISPTPGTYDLRPFCQWTFADIGGPNQLPIGTSNALEIRVEK